jgi:hypothetical protein
MADPTKELYFLRMDTRTVVKDQTEYDVCVEDHIPMRHVSYNSAVDFLNKEEAAARKLKKRRAHGKVAHYQRTHNGTRR